MATADGSNPFPTAPSASTAGYTLTESAHSGLIDYVDVEVFPPGTST